MKTQITNGAPVMGSTPDSVHPYELNGKDTLTALFALVIGFLFWEWEIPFGFSPTLGVFIFLLIIAGVTFFYIREKGIKQTPTTKIMPALMVFFSCYFLVFDNTPLHFFMFIFVIFIYVIWVTKASGTTVMKKLNGFILGDFLNQVFVIPFGNFSGMFRALFLTKNSDKKTALSLVIGLLASMPVLLIVVALLIQADDGFRILADNIFDRFDDFYFVEYLLELLVGIPIACYFFGYVYGNHHKRKVNYIKYDNLNSRFIKLHAIPRPAVYGPLVILNVIYIIFFIALGSYLFSAFGGDLPASMTYAEYARRGFFELCGVAAINLSVIAFSYTSIKRKETEYPSTLKILTGTLSLFTILLLATAMSKMALYIFSFGLTRLRIYTFWFMIVILFVLILVLIWHLKPYNIGKPLIIGCLALFIVLAASNTDGLIARYNIEAYEANKLKNLDTLMFYDLSDAAYPHVSSFAKRTDDPRMKKEMEEIADYYALSVNGFANNILEFNLQSYRAGNNRDAT